MNRKELESAPLNVKLDKCREVIAEAFDRYPLDRLAIAWTGGKDSTLVLWMAMEVCRKRGHKLPACFCIDEGDVFDEIRAFLAKHTADWGLDFHMIHNHDVSSKAEALGAPIRVAELNERNRKEVARLGYAEEEFFYEPESLVGNHLMKTATLNMFLDERKVAAFFEGIRWDEQGARSEEKFFSPRAASETSPAHMRVSPILHLKEREVWEAMFKLGVPYCELYKQGYRSLGARVTTRKTGDAPAWEQDLESAPERVGRRQDKEGMMGKLRELGYM
ncbi:MAG: Phosphoadenosine phosphosulfate reductase [Phycisphaerae bacterium]|nr:Phosphoadenosine phosphosulfate reductase [Phycisphaerae bacterium]